MFQDSKSSLKILLRGFVVINFVELGEEPFQGVHDFEAKQIVEALKATDPDAFVEDVKGFEGENFLFLIGVVESEC